MALVTTSRQGFVFCEGCTSPGTYFDTF